MTSTDNSNCNKTKPVTTTAYHSDIENKITKIRTITISVKPTTK